MNAIRQLAGANRKIQSQRDYIFTMLAVRCLEFGLYGMIVGWPIIVGWMLFVVLADAAANWAGARLVANPTGSVKPFAIAYFLQAFFFASLAVPLWSRPGSYGAAVAMIMMTFGILRANFESRGTRAAWIGLAPQIAFLIIAPVWAWASHAGPFAPPAYWMSSLLLVVAARRWGMDFAEADERASAALKEAEMRRLQAESATAAKSAFVAMVSHDLRTPISGVLAAAEELKRRHGDPDAASSVSQMISEAGGMMRTLLNDLLDLSKIEAGRMTVETIPFDLAALLEHVCTFHLIEAKAKGLALNLITNHAPPHVVEGDPTRIQQILNNLLSNALKFTAEGAVTLSQSCETREDGVLWVEIKVADTGAGLSPDRLSRLFHPYEQTDASVARSHGGTGLGLCISRDLARLMGGDITVSSEEGHGATFTVTLALREAAADAPAGLSPPVLLQPPANLRLLIAEDHEINRRVLRVLLEPLAPEIQFVEDGEAALEALGQTAFDMILTDLQMPKVGGLELARRVRARAGPNQMTPILALTGSGQADDVAACLDAGMNGHVTKPLEAGLLFAAMAAVCGRETPDQSSAEEHAGSALLAAG